MSIKKGEKPEAPGEDGQGDEPFLRRWTRRKSDAAVDSATPEPEPREPEEAVGAGDDTGSEQEHSEQDDRTADAEAPALDDLDRQGHKGDEDMPSLETIDEGGSVSEFFSPGVSQGLRRAALRRLFAQSNLPVGDDLDDYAGDYTNLTKLGDLVTNEMRHRFEIARQRLARRAEEKLAQTEPAQGTPSPEIAAAESDPGDVDEPSSGADENEEQEISEHDRALD